MTWNPHLQTANQPTAFYRFDQVLNVAPITVAPPIFQPPFKGPDSLQTWLFSQSITVPRAGGSPALAVNGGDTQQREENLRDEYYGHRTYHPIVVAPNEGLAPSPVVRQMPPPGIIARPSQMPPPGPSQMPVDPRPGFFMSRAERQAGDHPEPEPFTVRTITADDQYREMLINEVDNAMALVRGGTENIEDFLANAHFEVPEDDPEIDDQDDDDDMAIDVDSLSYEELLELEEEIGPVTTRLSSNSILIHLKQRKYQLEASTPAEGDLCCVCQEEYVAGDNIGKLDCGHEYHADCISQWLVLNNTCPVCKARGLAALRRR
ncbi:hypothetical protein ACOSP7_023167 [Xanthoceras sorbifolium]